MQVSFTPEELRARDELVARATLDWWDFDGSYRQANDFDDETDHDIEGVYDQLPTGTYRP